MAGVFGSHGSHVFEHHGRWYRSNREVGRGSMWYVAGKEAV